MQFDPHPPTLSPLPTFELGTERTHDYPLDAGRKLNTKKNFRRRSRRLLNVLYTFNLRSVAGDIRFLISSVEMHRLEYY